jgi:hypothetical protein
MDGLTSAWWLWTGGIAAAAAGMAVLFNLPALRRLAGRLRPTRALPRSASQA